MITDQSIDQGIPCIIHQTWRDHNVPEAFEQMSHSWRNKHPQWEYRFWTDEMNRDFIASNFPSFLPVYDNYPTAIQRVDAVRYLVLYKYGGFYIDMDFECLSGIHSLVSKAPCVFGKEPVEHCLIHEKEIIISNAFMGAVPGTHFFESICNELQSFKIITDHRNNQVLESTGPFMLSRIYSSYERKSEISLLEADLLYPFTMEELEQLGKGQYCPELEARLEKAYGIHHYAGTWWKKNKTA